MSNKEMVPKIRFEGFESEWENQRIKEIALVSTGKSNTQDKVEYGLYPFYVRSPIIERSNQYLYDEESVLTVGDGVGTGKVHHYVNGKYDLHQRVYRMYDFSDKVKGKYFYYYFSKKFYDRVMSMTAKTSVDSVRYDMISEMEIKLPSVDEQKNISNYLTELDKSINLKTIAIDTLKNFKQAMLQKMFPKEGEIVPEVRFKGFEGEWKTKSLKDLLQSEFKGKAQAEKLSLGHTEYLDANRLNGGQPIRVNAIKDVSRDDILILWDGSKAGTVYFGFEGVLGSTLKSFVVNQENYPAFVYQYLRGKNHNITTNYRTPNIPHVVRNFTETFRIPTPAYEEQKKIGKYFNVLDENIQSKQAELDKLKQFKQAMLDKMFV